MVIHGDELIMLLLGLAVLAFIRMNRKRVKSIPGYKTFVSAFFCFLAAWVFTVLEGFFWMDTLNFLEHALYVSGTALFFIWVLKIGRQNKLESG